ncbi:hypothetical protein ACFT54_09680 [Streptomyces cinereoruber]|uniref:hypothetical protein n=1 Tax=Streptomyces cinereoruber TaxID=67260 RepID=UPI00363751E1
MSVTLEEIAAALDAADAATSRGPRLERHRLGLRGESWDEAFHARTVQVEGGHLHWLGQVNHSMPVLAHHRETRSAYRFAFALHHGRQPEGPVLPTCDYSGCVAGGHLADGPMRARRAVSPP